MAGAEYKGAIWIPSPHFFGGSNRPRWIILHGTVFGNSAQEVADWFTTPQNGNPTAVHFVIGRDGVVVQCVHMRDGAWGNGVVSRGHDPWWNPNINPNNQTISIEHVKNDGTNHEGLTAAQQAASFKLIAWLCATHGIPAKKASSAGGITGHFSIDPINRSGCPGTYPWSALFSYLGHPTNVVPGIGGSGGSGSNTIGGGIHIKHGGKGGSGSSGSSGGFMDQGGTGTDALGGGLVDQFGNSVSDAAAALGLTGVDFLTSIFLQANTIQRAPVSGGLLGMTERVDQVLEIYPPDADHILAWGIDTIEAVAFRALIVLMGLIIIAAVMFNIEMKLVQQEVQVAGPLLQAAAAGAL